MFSGGDEAIMFAPMTNPSKWSWYKLSEIKCYLAATKWAYIHEGTISEHDYMLKIAFYSHVE
jgi:hypothetical protein